MELKPSQSLWVAVEGLVSGRSARRGDDVSSDSVRVVCNLSAHCSGAGECQGCGGQVECGSRLKAACRGR